MGSIGVTQINVFALLRRFAPIIEQGHTVGQVVKEIRIRDTAGAFRIMCVAIDPAL